MVARLSNPVIVDIQICLSLCSLSGIKRAGADMILTYFAKQAAGWLR